MIVVATTVGDLAGVVGRLMALGVRSLEVVEPGRARRVVLATLDDATGAAGMAASLRAEGLVAVTKPQGGAALPRWIADTRPVCFGGRLTVCPAWSEHDRRDRPGLVELGFGGFGNGHHPTTRQMIEVLLERITGGERVLDVGCGSGILGLCALRLGAARVVAVDIADEAVQAAKRNAAINAVSSQLETTLAPLADIAGRFDAVVANIARAGVAALADELVSHTAPGGWLAVGGLSPSQCSQAAGFLHPLAEVERRTEGEWSTLVLSR